MTDFNVHIFDDPTFSGSECDSDAELFTDSGHSVSFSDSALDGNATQQNSFGKRPYNSNEKANLRAGANLTEAKNALMRWLDLTYRSFYKASSLDKDTTMSPEMINFIARQRSIKTMNDLRSYVKIIMNWPLLEEHGQSVLTALAEVERRREKREEDKRTKDRMAKARISDEKRQRQKENEQMNGKKYTFLFFDPHSNQFQRQPLAEIHPTQAGTSVINEASNSNKQNI